MPSSPAVAYAAILVSGRVRIGVSGRWPVVMSPPGSRTCTASAENDSGTSSIKPSSRSCSLNRLSEISTPSWLNAYVSPDSP